MVECFEFPARASQSGPLHVSHEGVYSRHRDATSVRRFPRTQEIDAQALLNMLNLSVESFRQSVHAEDAGANRSVLRGMSRAAAIFFIAAHYDKYVVGAMAGGVCRVATPPKLDDSRTAVRGVSRYLAWSLV